MPCMCHYTPSDEDMKYLKDRCVEIVAKIKELRKKGDPHGCELYDIVDLLRHLYEPSLCEER